MRYLKRQTTNTSSLNGRGIKYSAAELATIDSESALLLPKGTTGARPSPVEGMIRYNTTTQNFEAYEANPAFGTPGWKKFRTDEPKLIHAQNLGNGDNIESLFGPLDANDPVSPVPSAPAQVLTMVENVLQIPVTNYTFIQNPCYYNSNQISFWADISTSGKFGAGAFAPGTSAAFSNNVGTVDFSDAGFYVGQTIFISGTTNNNGAFTVVSVAPTFLEINETFINENDPGYATVSTVEGLVNQSVESGTFRQTQDSTADVVVLNSTAGLEVNNMIVFDTSSGNIIADTIYFVKTISGNQITLSATAGGSTFDLGDSALTGNWIAGIGYGRQPSGSTIASATTAGSNLITVITTASMAVGQEISFTGTGFGNLVDGVTYYIVNIPSAITLQISATFGGPVFALTTATGYMQVATLGNNLYMYFGTPVPLGKPVTVLHNFDK
jgi:hypothetical protein